MGRASRHQKVVVSQHNSFRREVEEPIISVYREFVTKWGVELYRSTTVPPIDLGAQLRQCSALIESVNNCAIKWGEDAVIFRWFEVGVEIFFSFMPDWVNCLIIAERAMITPGRQ